VCIGAAPVTCHHTHTHARARARARCSCRYEVKIEAEVARSNGLCPRGKHWGKCESREYGKNDPRLWALQGGRYQVVFGGEWRAAVKEIVDRSWCNVNDMIDHVVAEGDRIFADTPCVIFLCHL
jgi:hypothetical protein